MAIAYLGLGSNLGRREDFLRQAIEALEQTAGRLLKCSSFIETAPWGYASDHPYLNAALSLETALTPQQLLKATQQIERRLGRTLKTTDGHYHDRVIDIDILYYDDLVVSEPGLTIPHPRLHQRRFVLEPLSEIAPRVIDPQRHLTVAEMLSRLDG